MDSGKRRAAVGVLAGLALVCGAYAAAPVLTVRQFDIRRDGAIELVADTGEGGSGTFDVLELTSDRSTAFGKARTVGAVPMGGLLRAAEYPCDKPVVNLFLVFAGRHTDHVRMLNRPEFAAGLAAGLEGVQGRAVRLYMAEPGEAGGFRDAGGLDALGQELASAQKKIKEGCPSGFFGWLFGSSPYTSIDAAAGAVRTFALSDNGARDAAANVALILWAGRRDNDIVRSPDALSADAVFSAVMVEAGSCAKPAVPQVRRFAQNTRGAYFSVKDINKNDRTGYTAVAEAVLAAFVRNLSGKHLLSVRSANSEDTEACWFSVGLAGSSIRTTVACTRDAATVRAARAREAAALAETIAACIRRGDFGAAHALLSRLAATGGNRKAAEDDLFAAIWRKAQGLVDKGEFDAAHALLGELAAFGGDGKGIADALFAAVRAKALSHANRAEPEATEALAGDLGRYGGDADALRKDALGIIFAQAEKLADGKDFTQSWERIRWGEKLVPGSTAGLAASVTGKWRAHAVALAAGGGHDAATAAVSEIEKRGLLDVAALARLREDVSFETGKWSAGQPGRGREAAVHLRRWRDAAQAQGRKAGEPERWADGLLLLARSLTGSFEEKDREDAAEALAEVFRTLPARFDDKAALGVLGTWLIADGNRTEQSWRLGHLLTRCDPIGNTAYRALNTVDADTATFFAQLLLKGEERAVYLDEQRKKALAETSVELNIANPVDKTYWAERRARISSEILATALDIASELGVPANDWGALLTHAVAGLNMRQMGLYADADAAERYLLARHPIRFVKDADGIGYGIAIERHLFRYLHRQGAPVVFHGADEDGPAAVLLVPVKGEEKFFAVGFSGKVAVRIVEDTRRQVAGSGIASEQERKEAVLQHLEIRDNEYLAGLGAELLREAVVAAGTKTFVAQGGRQLLERFHLSIPANVRGFTRFDVLAVREGRMEADPLATFGDGVTARAVTGVSYGIWDNDRRFFEVGLPVYVPGNTVPTGFLRIGLKSARR